MSTDVIAILEDHRVLSARKNVDSVV